MPVATQIADALDEARRRTLALVAPFSDADVETAHSALMSPLVWDLAHIAAYEDLWLVHRHGGEPLLHPELAAMYDAFETPRAVRGDLPLLDRAEALDYLADVRERALSILDRRGPARRPRDGAPARAPAHGDDAAGDRARPARHRARARRRPRPGRAAAGLEAIDVPAGRVRDGRGGRQLRVRQRAPAPRRSTCRPSASAAPRSPTRRSSASSRAAATSAASGGRTRAGRGRRTTTSPTPGWAAGPDGWRQWRVDGWSPLHPQEPVVHVSWFEADAFARAHDARLPTEAEWEKAATWNQETLEGRRVWEWTATEFDGYPGFRAAPLPRVLRGLLPRRATASCAAARGRPTRASRRATFRNWDLPQRRQIFSGVRLAWDA